VAARKEEPNIMLRIRSESRESVWCIQANPFIFSKCSPFSWYNDFSSLFGLPAQQVQKCPSNIGERYIQNGIWAFYTLRKYHQTTEDFETKR